MGEGIVRGIDGNWSHKVLGRLGVGKLTDSQDSFDFFFRMIDPRTENFIMEATFEVEDASGAGFQTGYGIMVVDTVESPTEQSRHRNHLMVGRFRTLDGRNHGYGLRVVGGYSHPKASPQDGKRNLDPSRTFKSQEPDDVIRPGDARRFILEKTDEGFTASMETWEGSETIKIPGCDFLLRQDKKTIYVGIATTGDIKLVVKDIRFETSPGILSRTPVDAIGHYVPDYPFNRSLLANLKASPEKNPFDLSSAILSAKPGSEIVLPDGEYKGGPFYIPESESGTPSNPVILRAEHSGKAIVDGSFIGAILPAMILRADHWIIDGIVFRNAPSSGLFICGNGNIIRNCEASGNGDTGILICSFPGVSKDKWPSGNRVEACVSRDNRDSVRSNADGFGAKLSVGKGNGFYSCKAFNNVDDGFDLYTKSTLGPIGPVTLESCEAAYNRIGFKLGGENQRVRHRLKGCVAHDNEIKDFDPNSNPAVRVQDSGFSWDIKRFICEIISFVFALLLFLTIVDRPYSKMAEKSNDVVFEAWYDVIHGRVDADMIVLGNSRAFFDFNPSIMDSILGIKTHDLGYMGCGLDRQEYMYDLYRKLNRKPSIVISCVDFSSMLPSEHVAFIEQLFPLFYYKAFRETVLPKESFTWAQRHIPMWRWVGYDPFSFMKHKPRSTNHGFISHPSINYDFNNATVDTLSFSVDRESILPLWDSFLARNIADSIKMVFVIPPLYKNYVYAGGEEQKMRSFLDSLANCHDVPVLDYGNLYIRQESTYFYDPDHLNRKGAKVLSSLVCEDLKRLGII